MIVDVDEMGTAFGKWMRFQPNGRSRKNHIANLKKISEASGNSYAPAAVTSDWLSNSQNSYHPQKLRTGELKLGVLPNQWRISASGASADVYGKLRKNPSGGRINNIRYHRPKILIKSFMPEDALRFRRGLEGLSECHQVMLWAHFVLVVVSSSKLEELREQGKLTCYQVTYKQKLELLQTSGIFYDPFIASDQYPKWLGWSRRAIEKEIKRTDAEIFFRKRMVQKKRKAQAAARRAPLDKLSTGPLWPCRIFASIHKFPIRHSKVKDLLPASFSPQGICNPRTTADFLPAALHFDNGYNVFRLVNGEIYVVISDREYGRLYRRGKASSFLAERRENAADYTYCHFDEWHSEVWHPEWIKPVPHYNAPAWMKERGLTLLDERAEHWAEELLNEPEKEHLWKRGGRELGWYL